MRLFALACLLLLLFASRESHACMRVRIKNWKSAWPESNTEICQNQVFFLRGGGSGKAGIKWALRHRSLYLLAEGDSVPLKAIPSRTRTGGWLVTLQPARLLQAGKCYRLMLRYRSGAAMPFQRFQEGDPPFDYTVRPADTIRPAWKGDPHFIKDDISITSCGNSQWVTIGLPTADSLHLMARITLRHGLFRRRTTYIDNVDEGQVLIDLADFPGSGFCIRFQLLDHGFNASSSSRRIYVQKPAWPWQS